MQIPRLKVTSEKEKKERQKKIFIGVLVAIILVLSSAGFALRQERQEYRLYGKNKFFLTEKGWNLAGTQIFTQFLPQDVENISFAARINIEELQGKRIYFVGNGAAEEIARNLPIYGQRACLSAESCPGELPIKNCSDYVIIIKKGEDKIYREENCIFLEARETTKAADRLLFSLYGIIK